MTAPVHPPVVPARFSSPGEDEVYLVVGGVMTSVAVASEAHSILTDAPGLMVRQPLARCRNPLALCDYHAEAAPYRDQYYLKLAHHGHRGAAAPPTTKFAFMHALRSRTASAMRDSPLLAAMPLAAEAYDAMRTDVSYVMAMSKMAVSVLSKQHAWRLRSELRQAQQEAMSQCQHQTGEFTCDSKSACGTGSCRFACGIYQTITPPAGEGKTARPGNHRGGPFSSDSALEALEKLRPFKVRDALGLGSWSKRTPRRYKTLVGSRGELLRKGVSVLRWLPVGMLDRLMARYRFRRGAQAYLWCPLTYDGTRCPYRTSSRKDLRRHRRDMHGKRGHSDGG